MVNSQVSTGSNLPLQLTSLIGREREVAATCELLGRDEVRLVTLSGPPGIGKTRLALRVASRLLADFEDGVYFVNLAPITDAALIVPTVAYTLGVGETGGQSLAQSLKRFLSEKQTLLVLDNFEQVVEGAPQVTELLLSTVKLKVLVTSRELLHLSGEHNFPVPPLSMPPVLTDHGSVRALAHLSSERIAAYEAVQLFAQRASALKPDFALTESNALAVAAICSRLDGLPLPIELAAARIPHLSPQAILDRLQDRFRLLTGGTQDLPARQRTLQATIDWSYSLLSEEEQRLLRRLAVFKGGATLAAIEAVCNADGDLGLEVFDAVTSLVDKSLLRPEYEVHSAERTDEHQGRAGRGEGEPDGRQSKLREHTGANGEPNFTMLETIHEYARVQLVTSGEAEAITSYHAAYYYKLGDEAEPQLRGPQQAEWLNRLERERENFRAALDWMWHHNVSVGMQLAAVLATFWTRRAHFSEGQEWLSRMLTRARDAGVTTAEAIAHAQLSLGFITWHLGDMQAARPFLEESTRVLRGLHVARTVFDRRILVEALNVLGIVVGRLDSMTARRRFHEEALAIAEESGDEWSAARSLYQLGHTSRMSGDYTTAQSLFEQSLERFRSLGDEFNIGLALIGAGLMAQQRADFEAAHSLFGESLSIYRALGVPWATASVLYCLGSVALDQADYIASRSFLEESLALQRELGTRGDVAEGLDNLGRAAYFQGDYSSAYTYYTESLALFGELGDRYGTALCLTDLAGVMISVAEGAKAPSESGRGRQRSRHEKNQLRNDNSSQASAVAGGQLLGAAQAMFASSGIQLNQMGQKLSEAYLSAVRQQLGEQKLSEALAAGRSMDLESATALVRRFEVPQDGKPGARAGTLEPAERGSSKLASSKSPLTRREREIAALLASGSSNRQIADTLVMSERTVEWHASNILSKLGFQSRAQIAVWAVEQGLIAAS